jgi:hypothetical protein
MDGNKLIIKYSIGWDGKPHSTNDPHPQGVMQLYLDQAFQTWETKAGKEKCLDVVHGRKLMKFIIQAGSNENIEQLRNWLKQHQKLWLAEFEKLCDGRW